MQANSRVGKVIAAVLIVALLVATVFVGASYGGSSGRTWFNLPSIKLTVNPNGTVSAYGIPINMALLQPDLIQQLQAANVQRLEVRWGYNGLHVYANGENMPYLAWDEASTETLQDVVRALPQAGIAVPYRETIANLLPWLRTIGWGVKLDLPLAGGATALDIPRWSGETSVTPAAAGEPTMGPLAINNLAFDEQGNGYIGPVSLAQLGVPVTLPPIVLNLVNALGVDTVTLDTEPDGLHIQLGDRPFPTLAYDQAHLERGMGLVNVLAPNAGMTGLLNDVAAALPGADLQIAVSFTGEPVGELDLSNLAVDILPDGSVRALGLSLPGGPLIPAGTLDQLRAANIQQLDLNLRSDGVTVVSDGQPLPAISWTPAGLDAVSTIVGPLTGMGEEQIDSILQVVGSTDLGLSLSVPAAEGEPAAEEGAEEGAAEGEPPADQGTVPAAPGTVPAPEDAAAPAEGEEAAPGAVTFAPPNLGEFDPPVLRAALSLGADGSIESISNLATADLAAAGLPVSSLALPANVMQILGSLNADEIGLTNAAGTATLSLDGEEALSLQYDTAALGALLEKVKPFLNVEMLDNPLVSRIIDEYVLPIAPGAEVDLRITMP